MEMYISSVIHIINFILKHLEIIIPLNLLLARIREQAPDFFVIANFWVEELRFWQPFKKAKKYFNIMSWIHFKILGKIVDLYSTGLFPKWTEH